MKRQFITMNEITENFENQYAGELPAIPRDGIIRGSEGRPLGYLTEDGRAIFPLGLGDGSWKQFFEEL